MSSVMSLCSHHSHPGMSGIESIFYFLPIDMFISECQVPAECDSMSPAAEETGGGHVSQSHE